MKQKVVFIIFLVMLLSCHSRKKDINQYLDEIREDFAKQAEIQNNKTYAWENKIRNIYNLADNKFNDGVRYADSLIKNDKSLDKWDISELHTIVGELYYDKDSIDLALERFYINQKLTFDSPKNKANKAGCYVKKGDLDKAMLLLKEAAEINHDYKWYIGNLYEIQGEVQKAIDEYEYVYQRDTLVYKDYKKRSDEIKENPNQLMDNLFYKDRRKRILLLLNTGNNK